VGTMTDRPESAEDPIQAGRVLRIQKA